MSKEEAGRRRRKVSRSILLISVSADESDLGQNGDSSQPTTKEPSKEMPHHKCIRWRRHANRHSEREKLEEESSRRTARTAPEVAGCAALADESTRVLGPLPTRYPLTHTHPYWNEKRPLIKVILASSTRPPKKGTVIDSTPIRFTIARLKLSGIIARLWPS